jgi:hypothetical protein
MPRTHDPKSGMLLSLLKRIRFRRFKFASNGIETDQMDACCKQNGCVLAFRRKSHFGASEGAASHPENLAVF